MFKSCHYCRHRKKKCVWPHDATPDDRCLACQHLDVVCEIGARKPSLKRQQKSRRIASEVLNTGPGNTSRSLRPDIHLQTVAVKNGDCQVFRPRAADASKVILFNNSHFDRDGLGTKEKYTNLVSREFPFIPENFLQREDEISPTLRHCIALASQLFLGNQGHHQLHDDLQHLYALLGDQQMDLFQVAGILLLLPRVVLDHGTVTKAFDTVTTACSLFDVPLPIISGSLAAHTWLTLVGHDLPSLTTSPSALLEHAGSLDPNVFAGHYLRLTHLAASIVDLRKTAREEEHDEKLVQLWATFEHAALLNVAQMPSEFLDVRDDLPATPAAVVTHMLQSLIYLHIYGFMLCETPTLGQALGIRPVPGVLHFVCAVARSVFVCPRQVMECWPLLHDVQAEAARIVLQFSNMSRFENCRALLNLWEPDQGTFEALRRKVRHHIGVGPWDVELIDGYSVFWTFMDLRSLSLEMRMCNEQ